MEAYLRTFLAVFKSGAINRAAALLHKSEPAVSYHIRSLEAACGKPLFDRVGRRIVPNQAGRFLYRAVEPMIGALDTAVSTIRGDASSQKSPVWVSSVSGFGRYVLAPIM